MHPFSNALGEFIRRKMWEMRVQNLVAMPDDELKALWDQYDGCNAPDGHQGEDIHLALNLKGLGDHCAV